MNTNNKVKNDTTTDSLFYTNFLKLCDVYCITSSTVLNGINVSTDCIEQWKKGENISYEILDKLSSYFDIPVDYFFRVYDNRHIIGKRSKQAIENPFGFAYEILLALCCDKNAKAEYKEIVQRSWIRLPPFFDEKSLKDVLKTGKFTPSLLMSVYYILSKIEKSAIPKGLCAEYERELNILCDKGCNRIVSWSNPLIVFHFRHTHIMAIIRLIIKSAGVKRLWRNYIRFNERYIADIRHKEIIDYIANCCPAVHKLLMYLIQ